MSEDLTATADALRDDLATRLAAAPLPVGVSFFLIGDEGAEERHLGPAGEHLDRAAPAAAAVRWEYVEDAVAVHAGTTPLAAIAQLGRIELTGDDRALNALAPMLEPPGDGPQPRFLPFVTRTARMSDDELRAVIALHGREAILRDQLVATAYAYQAIDLVTEAGGPNRCRWTVAGTTLDLVGHDDGTVTAEESSGTPDTSVGFDELTWIRWLGCTCAPPLAPGEPGQDVGFIESLISGKATFEGDFAPTELVGKLLPHTR